MLFMVHKFQVIYFLIELGTAAIINRLLSGLFNVCRCYCILHKENILGAIFSMWTDLRTAKSWEEVEETVWGDLNKYSGFC